MCDRTCLIVDSPTTIVIGASLGVKFDKVILEVINPDAVHIENLTRLASSTGLGELDVHILPNPYHKLTTLRGIFELIKISLRCRNLSKLLKEFTVYGPNNSLVMSFIKASRRVYFDHGLGEIIERAHNKMYIIRRLLGFFFVVFTRGVLYKVPYYSLLDEKKPLAGSLGNISITFSKNVNNTVFIDKNSVDITAMFLFGHDSFLSLWREPTETEVRANIELINSIYNSGDLVVIKFHPSIFGEKSFSSWQGLVNCRLILADSLLINSDANSVMAESYINHFDINRLDSRWSATNFTMPGLGTNRCHLAPFSDFSDYERTNWFAERIMALSNTEVEIIK